MQTRNRHAIPPAQIMDSINIDRASVAIAGNDARATSMTRSPPRSVPTTHHGRTDAPRIGKTLPFGTKFFYARRESHLITAELRFKAGRAAGMQRFDMAVVARIRATVRSETINLLSLLKRGYQSVYMRPGRLFRIIHPWIIIFIFAKSDFIVPLIIHSKREDRHES